MSDNWDEIRKSIVDGSGRYVVHARIDGVPQAMTGLSCEALATAGYQPSEYTYRIESPACVWGLLSKTRDPQSGQPVEFIGEQHEFWLERGDFAIPFGSAFSAWKRVGGGEYEVKKRSEDRIDLLFEHCRAQGLFSLVKAADGWNVKGPIQDRYSIRKTNDEQRYTLGVAYPSAEVDVHNDTISPRELEKAAWGYMAASKGIGIMHKDGTTGSGTAVESYIYRGPDWKIEDQVVKAGDWLLGVIWSEPAWAKIKSGDFTGYSLQGYARKG